MPFLFSYLLKLSIAMTAVYLFYQLVLRRLTFYQWNRFYLLGYTLLCFVIPFIKIEKWIGQSAGPDGNLITFIPALDQLHAMQPVSPAPVTLVAEQATAPAWGLYDWLGFALLSGTVFMTVRLGILFFSLYRLRRRSVLLGVDGGTELFESADPITPFSFGRSIYINRKSHTEEELRQIMRHEYVHVRQRHTIDILVGELICLVNWYNPFAWLLRHAIRQNLEFVADSNVLANGVDRKEYQYLLLKVMGAAQYRIANNFNFSNLKKRIVMMNKMKSARLHLTRFLFVLPLLLVLLAAFRGKTGPEREAGSINDNKHFVAAGIVCDLYTKKPLAHAQVKETASGVAVTTDEKGFYKMQVPVQNAGAGYQLIASLDGYEPTQINLKPGNNWKNDGALLEVLALQQKNGPSPKGMYLTSFTDEIFSGKVKRAKPVTDPTYADAVKTMDSYVKTMKDFDIQRNLLDENPGVANFYTTEDKKKHIVFLKNGGIERYGYPGTPSVSALEKKYGELPSWSKEDPNPATYYHQQWEEISTRLSKTFTTTSSAQKAIIFPGDSRVLVQSPENKVEFYDMDYQQDRDKFEALYGKLPDLPPAGRSDKPVTATGTDTSAPKTSTANQVKYSFAVTDAILPRDTNPAASIILR
ncbi:MAG: hypothetical protein JST39_14845, partial [Bacteroidetes bacterium]|nr:hypothetical protein [Bacteroidota bacterium]